MQAQKVAVNGRPTNITYHPTTSCLHTIFGGGSGASAVPRPAQAAVYYGAGAGGGYRSTASVPAGSPVGVMLMVYGVGGINNNNRHVHKRPGHAPSAFGRSR